MDLATVSALTNTTFDIYQRKEAEILACVQYHHETKTGISVYGLIQRNYITDPLVNSQGHSFYYLQEPGDMFNLEMYDIANSICFPVYLDLLGFTEQRKNCTRTKGGEYIPLTACTSWSAR
jgi:hypothetical protein